MRGLHDEMCGTVGSDGSAEEEPNEIGDDLEDDDPPGVAGFNTCLLSFLRVGYDVLDLFL